MIVSCAHDWQQVLGNPRRVWCSRCGVIADIGAWDVPRCVPHGESDASGFADEEE